MSRLRGNASGRNGNLSWFCSGCGKKHSISRTIEGVRGANNFCGASLRRKKSNATKPAHI